jgi:hypothetical protein
MQTLESVSANKSGQLQDTVHPKREDGAGGREDKKAEKELTSQSKSSATHERREILDKLKCRKKICIFAQLPFSSLTHSTARFFFAAAVP